MRDDSPNDDVLAAIERRSMRATPAGPGAALARARAAAHSRGSRRGGWLAAVAVVVALGGLAISIAAVDGPDSDEIVLGADNHRGGVVPPDPIECTGSRPVNAAPQAEPCGALWPQATPADAAASGLNVLVVNGTWGKAVPRLAEELVGYLGEPAGGPFADLGLRATLVIEAKDAPIAKSFVHYVDSNHRAAAEEVAKLVGVGTEGVKQANIRFEHWSSHDLWQLFPEAALVPGPLEPFDLLLVVGADLDPAGADCVNSPAEAGCLDPQQGDGGDAKPSVLHPPPEVSVLVLNATTTKGAAATIAEELKLTHRYDVLEPADTERLDETSVVYYEPGYELDARQIAHILTADPSAVQPRPDEGLLPTNVAGDPHIVAVIGTDLEH